MGEATFALLDELRIIAQNGLEYADDPYNRERYERILELVADQYEELADPAEIHVEERFTDRLGHVSPNVGGLAAVFDDDGQILLIRRADDDTWGMPGGYSEPGESPSETARRETREETGFLISPSTCIASEYREPDDENPHGFVSMTYLGTVVGGEENPSHEATAVEYWDVDAVPVWHKDHEGLARRAFERWAEQRP